MRPPVLAATAAVAGLALLATGCGGRDPKPPRAEPRVKLELGAPTDATVVRAETVQVSGSVRPASARVQVLGREVAVESGRFSAAVPLEPGANLVDVAASARGRRPDFAAMRIVREVRVAVPGLLGRDADTAREQLEGLGLDVDTKNGGGLFDPILPGDPKVCLTDPPAGTQVLPGSKVELTVARNC
jgi:hypothetical protein